MLSIKWRTYYLALGLCVILALSNSLSASTVSALWKRQFPNSAPVAEIDDDNDGYSNLEESIAGTDPGDPSDFLRLKIAMSVEGGLVDLSWEGFAGKSYLVEILDPKSGEWLPLSGAVAGENAEQRYTATGSGIVRVVVRDVDQDQDGVLAYDEALLGWSDLDHRSAGVGVHDYEAYFGLLEGVGTLELPGNGKMIQKELVSVEETSLFLSQASFGGTRQEILATQSMGLKNWLSSQITMSSRTKTDDLLFTQGEIRNLFTWSKAWWKSAMIAEDQLRLRMNYALSQIFVVSASGNDTIRGVPELQAHYYDLLGDHAFGSYRELLEDVTFSTEMGSYLSHLFNARADPEIGRFPDENFAREIMQLFSIGLWKLETDGTLVKDEEGQPIPTYDNSVITEMAKVFTGFGFGDEKAGTINFIVTDPLKWRVPMRLHDEAHEPGEKLIFNGLIIPAEQTAKEDVSMVLDALAAHSNTAPFISRLLIQRFTSSDPSSEYLFRVSRAWLDSDGNLGEVVRAILIDPEVRSPEERERLQSNGYSVGKLREPYLRLAHLLRFFKARNQEVPATFPVVVNFFDSSLGQRPMFAPSVFNFYLPDYHPAGLGDVTETPLVAPEMQIATPERLIGMDNLLGTIVRSGLDPRYLPDEKVLKLDYDQIGEKVENMDQFLEALNLYFVAGRLTERNLEDLKMAIESQNDVEKKIQIAVHLIADSPSFVTF